MLKRISYIAAVLAFLTSGFAAAQVSGSVVVAKPGGNAIIIWQATPVVSQIVAQKTASADAIVQLEMAALKIMQARRSEIEKSATSLSVNVIYARTGDVSPIYKTVTFGGFEHLFTVTASKSAITQSATWTKSINANRLPPGVAVKITGTLPQ